MEEFIFSVAGTCRRAIAISSRKRYPESLMADLVLIADQRDIPFEGRLGLISNDFAHLSGTRHGVLWGVHLKLVSGMMVLYHVDAVYPPALALDPDAIIYGMVGR